MKIFGLVQLTKLLFGQSNKGEVEMAKEDVVPGLVKEIQDGVAQVYTDELGKAYDGGFVDGVASVPAGSGGGFSQADIDAAVQAKVDADAIVLAQSQADDKAAFDAAKAVADAALADLKKQFDDLSVAKGIEDAVIAGLQSSKAQIEAALAALAGLFPQPIPVPDPIPEPDPVPTPDPAA